MQRFTSLSMMINLQMCAEPGAQRNLEHQKGEELYRVWVQAALLREQ